MAIPVCKCGHGAWIHADEVQGVYGACFAKDCRCNTYREVKGKSE